MSEAHLRSQTRQRTAPSSRPAVRQRTCAAAPPDAHEPLRFGKIEDAVSSAPSRTRRHGRRRTKQVDEASTPDITTGPLRMTPRDDHVTSKPIFRNIGRVAGCQLVQKRHPERSFRLGRGTGRRPSRPIDLDRSKNSGLLAGFVRVHAQGQPIVITIVHGQRPCSFSIPSIHVTANRIIMATRPDTKVGFFLLRSRGL